MRRIGIAAALGVLLGGVSAEAQTGLIEGGRAGLGAGISEDGVSATVTVGGFYVAGAGSPAAPADWLSIYGGLSNFSEDVGNMVRVGGGFRLGPQEWIARPSLRVGAVFADIQRATAGFGLYIGRQAGGVFTVDATSYEGVSFTFVHIGGYVGFGGGN